ncbi:MAG: Cytochrome bo(3) ubiquinol oxidase subunit 2 [Chlamydiae bacterium]|nr:Cytochrome bo(3) ubiquinol oxidase subunit 2 [Chlamydiota bacterium]
MKKLRIVVVILLLLGVAALAVLYISTHDIVVLNPKGMIGIKERHLIITASLLMLLVVIPVFIFTWFFAWRYRASNEKARHEPDWEHNNIAEFCWWGVPLIIVVILGVITWKSSHELNPFKPIVTGKAPITIQVVALDWKWLFIYPEQGIASVNFVEFPEKTPINFEITADAPMNSFWIPQLGGQIYAMPAMRTKLHLIANETGNFRGASANISGKGFAGMTFTAKSSTQEDFDRWVQKVRQSGKSLTLSEYKQLAEPSEYNPVVLYVLQQKDLFDRIVMKYRAPSQ